MKTIKKFKNEAYTPANIDVLKNKKLRSRSGKMTTVIGTGTTFNGGDVVILQDGQAISYDDLNRQYIVLDELGAALFDTDKAWELAYMVRDAWAHEVNRVMPKEKAKAEENGVVSMKSGQVQIAPLFTKGQILSITIKYKGEWREYGMVDVSWKDVYKWCSGMDTSDVNACFTKITQALLTDSFNYVMENLTNGKN